MNLVGDTIQSITIGVPSNHHLTALEVGKTETFILISWMSIRIIEVR